MNGKGYLILPNGEEHLGEFLNDLRHGYGQFKWKNNRIYSGFWKYGKQEGLGIMIDKKNDEGLDNPRLGEWHNGTRINWV
jgi:hypothetical protein